METLLDRILYSDHYSKIVFYWFIIVYLQRLKTF